MGTSLKVGIQMMKALEAVHDLGYIHREFFLLSSLFLFPSLILSTHYNYLLNKIYFPRFSVGTSLRLGIHTMKALEAVHDLGYIHRLFFSSPSQSIFYFIYLFLNF